MAIINTLMTVQQGIMCIQCTPSGIPAVPQAFGPECGQDAFSYTLNTHNVLLNNHYVFIQGHLWGLGLILVGTSDMRSAKGTKKVSLSSFHDAFNSLFERYADQNGVLMSLASG